MSKPHLILMGQTPPPWHGQAVATQILFEHNWPGYEVHRLRMEFSEEMLEVGRFQWKKLVHLWQLIRRARTILHEHPDAILLYPPASAKWVPFLRDAVFLWAVRAEAKRTVFIFHASGLPVFTDRGWFRRALARRIYHYPNFSLEVAQEAVPPHRAFHADDWSWCPCAIEVPQIPRPARDPNGPMRAIFVGSLQEGKGVLEILRTAKILKDAGQAPNYRFLIVGKWFSKEFEAQVKNLRKELQVEDMVEFPGQLTGDEKWQAYAAADVFFFPTHYESEATPIVIMEALGAGLPIVSTQWAGIPAMLEGCETAELLPPRQPKKFADALRRLHSNRPAAEESAIKSRQFYQDHFLPQRFIERVENALDSLNQPAAAYAATRVPAEPLPLSIQVYLADQNPKLGRSLGISRMTEVVFAELAARNDVQLSGISSRSSLQPPGPSPANRILPWSTRNLVLRVLTDHLHPVLSLGAPHPDIWYFPKGFLPRLHHWCVPSVVTIHDTIIQYYSDHYPHWRRETEYKYWASMLKHTLRHATAVLTVSESSKTQILTFMQRHGIPQKEIHVTYEPCLYESIPQPHNPPKEHYVLHLGSREPHKRTAWLIREWTAAMTTNPALPALHVVGTVPPEVEELVENNPNIVRLPFLEDDALRGQFSAAKALLLPSEIEGFGLPAIEAYYLGTPVCFSLGTSIEEVLAAATTIGGFVLDDAQSLFAAFDDVMQISPEEIREIGLKLRVQYASSKVAQKMMAAFHDACRHQGLAQNHS